MSDKNDLTTALGVEVKRVMQDVREHVDLDAKSGEWVAYAITQAAEAGVRVGIAHACAEVIENAIRLKAIDGATAADVLRPFENWTVSFGGEGLLPRPDDGD